MNPYEHIRPLGFGGFYSDNPENVAPYPSFQNNQPFSCQPVNLNPQDQYYRGFSHGFPNMVNMPMQDNPVFPPYGTCLNTEAGYGNMPLPGNLVPNPYGTHSNANIGFGAVSLASLTVPPVLTPIAPVQLPMGTPAFSPYPNLSDAGHPPLVSSFSPNPNGSPYMHSSNNEKYQGTVHEHHLFDSQSDAKLLKKAMKGVGYDAKTMIDILTKRTNKQRLKIVLDFKTLYGKDLIKEIKNELSGCFEELMCSLLLPPDEYDAAELHRAIQGLGTDEECLIEILCTRSNREIHAINNAYKVLYRRSLEQDIVDDTSGHFRRLMVSVCSGNRLESHEINQEKAKQDAMTLYDAGVNRWGTDESTFNSILAYQNEAQLQLVFEEYHRLTGHSMETAIKKEMSGDLEDGMLAIVKTIKNRPAFFAEGLYKSMKGLGTRDKTLIRIVVTRSEIDMVQIKQEFLKNYGKTLESFIADDTSGDYKRALLSLIGG